MTIQAGSRDPTQPLRDRRTQPGRRRLCLTSSLLKDSLNSFVSTLLKVSRRWFLRTCAALGGMSAVAGSSVLDTMATTGQMKSTSQRGLHIAVVGAGAFGGLTALFLLRRGARVTLVDSWGPGNSRSSSG